MAELRVRRDAEAVAKMREVLRECGSPVDDWSDDEVVRRVEGSIVTVARICGALQIDAARVFTKLAEHLRRSPTQPQ